MKKNPSRPTIPSVENGPRPRMRSAFAWLAVFVAGALLWSGCNFAPHYTQPPVETPAAFKEMNSARTNDLPGWKTAEPRDTALRGKWWELFNDPALNALEDQVAVSNQTVQASLAAFFSARSLIVQARSAYYPAVNFDPSVTRERQNLGSLASSSSTGTSSRSATFTTYSLPLDASWELDLWGATRNTVKADVLQTQAAAADLGNAQLTVQAEVAADYFLLRAQDAQKQILDTTVKAYKDSLELTSARFHTGIASDVDVAQAETVLTTTLAQNTDLEIERAQLEHAIAVLIGRPPAVVSLPFSPLKADAPVIPFGLPSELLERRPDIAAAERRVGAANAQIGVARAAYFPAVTLSGTVGYENTRAAELLSGPNFIWSVGASLAQSIFDAGKRYGATQQAKAQYEQTVANYRQTVLSAFQDVEDNLSSLRILAREIGEQQRAVQASQRYLDLSLQRYKLGIDSYLNVITAQTVLLNNQRTLVTLQSEQITASVQLIKAVGGGWDPSQTPDAKNEKSGGARAAAQP
jgi:NodT family efflux transporter outer membrane factor (OMF) lipoprotein